MSRNTRNCPEKAVCIRGCMTFKRKTMSLQRTITIMICDIESWVMPNNCREKVIELKIKKMESAHYVNYSCLFCNIAI